MNGRDMLIVRKIIKEIDCLKDLTKSNKTLEELKTLFYDLLKRQ